MANCNVEIASKALWIHVISALKELQTLEEILDKMFVL